MPYLELPGVRLWFEDSGGNGVPVVFLHAASGTFESWLYQLPPFTQAGYRCITYDRRGWGRSQPEDTGDQPGRGSLDLQGLVEHLGLDRFHLVATAAGGNVALDYALTYPERVRALVLASSIGGRLIDFCTVMLTSVFRRSALPPRYTPTDSAISR